MRGRLFDPARIAAAVQGKRVGHAVADDLEQVAGIRRRQDDALGCGAVLRSLAAPCCDHCLTALA